MQLNEVILNTTATTTAPKMWQEKTKNEIIQDLISFVDKMNQEDNGIQPPWSSVRISDEKEVKRLSDLRQDIKHYYPNMTGEVYFLGYLNKEQGQVDVWYLPLLKTILHTAFKPIGVENVNIDFTFNIKM